MAIPKNNGIAEKTKNKEFIWTITIFCVKELIELLEEIQPDADFENCDTLIDDGILDSFAILSIVSELQDTYDITITPADIIPENFNSAKALWDMVCRLKG